MLIRWKLLDNGLPVDAPTETSYPPFYPGQIKPIFSALPYFYGVLPELSSGYSDEEIVQSGAVIGFFNTQQKVFHPDGAALSEEEMQYLNGEAKEIASLLGEDVYSKAIEIDCAVRDVQNQQRDYLNLRDNGVVEEISEEAWVTAAREGLAAIKEQRLADVNAAYNNVKNSAPRDEGPDAKAQMMQRRSEHLQWVKLFTLSGDNADHVIAELNDFKSRAFAF